MLNQVTYTGRLVADAEYKIINEKSKVSNFTIAVDRDFKNNAGEIEADFFPIVAWNLPTWIVDNYLLKGMVVTVTGQNRSRTYEVADGSKRFVIELNAEHVYPMQIPKKQSVDTLEMVPVEEIPPQEEKSKSKKR